MKKLAHPEEDLQRLVVRAVEPLLIEPIGMWHTPMGGWRSRVEAAILKGIGAKPGISDLLFWPVIDPVRRTRVLAGIELKRPGRGERDLTDNQRRFGEWLVETGGLFACHDNLDDVLDTLHQWGAIRARRF